MRVERLLSVLVNLMIIFFVCSIVGDRSFGSQPGSARSSLSSLSDSFQNISYSSEVRVCPFFSPVTQTSLLCKRRVVTRVSYHAHSAIRHICPF